MNVLVATATIGLVWLAIGVIVAMCMSPPLKDRAMTDLLELKLDQLDDAVRAGRITGDARAAMASTLLDHVDLIAAMQDLVTLGEGWVGHAELIATSDAPELHITTTTAGKLHHWLELLRELDFCEIGITSRGYEFRGPYVVRITLPATEKAAA